MSEFVENTINNVYLSNIWFFCSLHCALLLWPTLHWLMEDFGHLFSTNRQTTRPPFSYCIVGTACPVNACHKDQFCMNCIHFHNCILAFGVTFARLVVTMEPKILWSRHILKIYTLNDFTRFLFCICWMWKKVFLEKESCGKRGWETASWKPN